MPRPVGPVGRLRTCRHVEHRLLRAVELGQADDAVDQQHGQQPWVAQLAAARNALVEIAQRLVVVADLLQLVGQIAVQAPRRSRARGWGPSRAAPGTCRRTPARSGLGPSSSRQSCSAARRAARAAALAGPLRAAAAPARARRRTCPRATSSAPGPAPARMWPGRSSSDSNCCCACSELTDAARLGVPKYEQVVADGQPRPGLAGHVVAGLGRLAAPRAPSSIERAESWCNNCHALRAKRSPFDEADVAPRRDMRGIIEFARRARYRATPI